MLFGDGVGFSGLFATHPPLLERIQALEPSFKRCEQLARLQRAVDDIAAGRTGGRPAPGLACTAAAHDCRRKPRSWTSRRRWWRRRSRSPTPTITGAPTRSWHRCLTTCARWPTQRDAVMPLLLALLLDGDERVAQTAAHGHRRAPRRGGRGDRAGAARAASATACIRCCACRWRRWRSRCCVCVRARSSTPSSTPSMPWSMPTASVSLFEYCLGRLLEVQVRESLDPSRHARFGRRKPGSVRQEFATLLAVVAQAGHADADARAARLPCRAAACAASRSPAVCAAARKACSRSTPCGTRSTRSIRWPSR